jgi:N-acetylglutamate synthase-like GNAT family acetyltransferase
MERQDILQRTVFDITDSPKPPTLRQLEKMHEDAQLPASPEALVASLTNTAGTRWLYAKYRGAVVGMARLEFHGRDFCHIAEVMVQKRFQGKGVGATLLKTIDAQCQRAGVELACLEPSANSASFYTHFGFQFAPTPTPSMFKRFREQTP